MAVSTNQRSIAIGSGAAILARLLEHARTPLYWNGYALIVSSGASSALGMVFWIVAARAYSAEAVGLNSAMIAAMMFLAGVSQFNLMSALIRFIPAAGRHTARFVLSTYLVSIVTAVFASIIFLGGLDVWAPRLAVLRSSPVFMVWFTLAAAVWCVQVLQDSVLTGLRQATWVPVSNILYAGLKVVLVVGLATVLPRYGVFAAWTGALVILIPTTAVIFWRLIPAHARMSPPDAERLDPMQVIRYVPADYLGSLAWLGVTTLLPILVASVVGLAETAYFYVAWGIAFALCDVGDNMGYSLVVEGANNPKSLRTTSRRVLVHTTGIVLGLALLVIVAAPYVLLVFGQTYAAEATTLLQLLALAAVPHTVNALYVSVARVQRRTGAVVAVLGTLCVLVLGMSYLLLGTYGITGVGIAWLFGHTSIAVVLLLTRFIPFWRADAASEPGRLV